MSELVLRCYRCQRTLEGEAQHQEDGSLLVTVGPCPDCESDAYEDGREAGYYRGYEEGRESGYQRGYEEGREDGRRYGWEEGYEEGLREGCRKQESW